MRKALLSLLTVLFVVAIVSAVAFAAEMTKAKGTLKAVDAEKGMVTFCPEGTKEDIPMKADKAMLKTVKAGDKVNVEYTKEGKDNVAKKITKARGAKVPVGC